MRLLLGFILLAVNLCFAVPSIGLTKLYYLSNESFVNNPIPSTSVESGTIPNIIRVNAVVINSVQQQLNTFPVSLQRTLAESGSFNVYDATPMLNLWSAKNPRLISKWEYESLTQEAEEDAADKVSSGKDASSVKKPGQAAKYPAVGSGNYVLIGWVSFIKADQIRQPFPETNKTSVLYNLNIEIKYKVIDADTQQIITQFVAAGLGGFARIIPTSLNKNTSETYETSSTVVADCLSSLLISIKHGLLIKQDLGILPK